LPEHHLSLAHIGQADSVQARATVVYLFIHAARFIAAWHGDMLLTSADGRMAHGFAACSAYS
jgi:hypothetical protein